MSHDKARDLVIFDAQGQIVSGTGEDDFTSPEKPKLSGKQVRDPNAATFIETYNIDKSGKITFFFQRVYVRMMIAGIIILLILMCFVGAGIKSDHDSVMKKFTADVEARRERGCKYPTMTKHGPAEMYDEHPDTGCQPVPKSQPP